MSDPNERKWYDDHKDQILRGRDGDDYTEDDASYITKSTIWKYFSTSCFQGFN